MDSHSRTGDDPFALPAADGPSAHAPPPPTTHERTLQDLYDHTPILMGVAAIHTDDLTLVTLNPAFAHLFGATPADLQGRPLRDLAIGPDNADDILVHARQAWHTGMPAQAAISWQSPTGMRWIHVTIAPILAPGMPPRCSIMGMDITTHVSAPPHGVVQQRDLAYRLAAATLLEEALPICLDVALHMQMDCGGIYLIDPASGDLKLAYARGFSPTCVAATRAAAAESDRVRMVMDGQPRYLEYDRIMYCDQAKADEDIRALAVLPLTYQGRVIGCFTLGSHRNTAAEVSPAARAALEAIVVQVSYVIVRLQAEAALRTSESRLHTILQTALDGFLVLDRQMRIIEVNDVYCAMSGYRRAELLGIAISAINVVDPLDPTNELPRIHAVLAAGLGRFEARHQRKDGSVFAIEASVYHSDSGDGGQLICFVRDITERQQREHEIRVLNSELERRVVARTAELSRVNVELARAAWAKDEFFATMSHELRTPLNAILMLSETLQEQVRGPLNVRQMESLATIESSGRHLLTLINDILDLSKAEAGQMDLNVDLVSVDDVCQASMLFVREMAAKKAIRLSCQLDDDQADLQADHRRLKQMLVNLLSNAVKFTPVQGEVRLEVATDAAAGVMRFVVQDTGIGIATEDMGRLFQPFQQLDSRLSRQHAGTGLGLALVRQLAALHGGGVTLESALGVGSRFTITLPYAAAQGAAARSAHTPALGAPCPALVIGDSATAADSPPARDRAASAHILLVEDTEMNIRALQDYLEVKGYQVTVARDGREAIEMAAAGRPDLIVMNIQMPRIDGLEATRYLRTMPDLAATPIIALTALAMPGDRERCLAAGASAYMTKPVSLNGLLEVIGRLLVP